MALFFADLVREACRDSGAGDLTLGGALPGHRAFADVVPPGARFHYAIQGSAFPDEWETGEGEIGPDGKLVRTPAASSTGGGPVSFTAGLKTVALTVCADWFEARDGAVAQIEDVVGLDTVLAGLETTLAGKAPAAHSHAFASLTGRPTTLAGYGITDAAVAGHEHEGAYQPADADLGAIAALSTTSFGRAHLTLADGAALRSHAGVGSIATQAASAVAITGGSISGITDLAIADGGTGASSAGAARNNLGVTATGGDTTYAYRANNLSDLASASAARTNLGLGSADSPAFAALTLSARLLVNGASLGQLGVNGSVHANPAETDTVFSGTVGTANAAFIGPNGYWALRGATNHSFNLDVFNAGSPIAALSIAQNGQATFASSVALGGTLSKGGVQVVGARRTGWTAAGGTAARTAFDTASVTTEALAQRVKALIDDLTAHGLIGA